MLNLEVDNLCKSFGRRKIFENINFSIVKGDSIAIIGPNGSGKTTMLSLLLGLSYPTKGKVIYSENNKPLNFEAFRRKLSLVAPYYSLYDSLSGSENLSFFAKIDGIRLSNDKIKTLLTKVGLSGRGDDFVSAYSTGMKQRLKYAVSLIREPEIMILDEPTANLDSDGKKIVSHVIEEYRSRAIIIIATNEKEEYSLAGQVCQLVS
ncbi:MAG: ABC transporter ATP-binding protein [Candidatus Zixiibacteriota bacterium]